MTLWEIFMAGFGGQRPRPEPPATDRQAQERIVRKLDHLERLLTKILNALEGAKERTMALTEQVAHLVEEVNQSRGLTASMATFVRGVPALVRQAVQEALAANPKLSAEDLAAISQAADDLDASQAEILSAMQANAVPGENTGTAPARTEMGGIVDVAPPNHPTEGGAVGGSAPGEGPTDPAEEPIPGTQGLGEGL